MNIVVGILLIAVALAVVVGIFIVLLRDTKKLFGQYQQIYKNWRKKSEPKPWTAAAGVISDRDYPTAYVLDFEEAQVRRSYKTMFNLMIGNGDKARAASIVDEIEWQEDDEGGADFDRFFNMLLQRIQSDVSHHLLLSMDWKDGVGELVHWISSALRDTNFKPKLPDAADYQHLEPVTFSMENINPWGDAFNDCIRALNDIGLGLCFMETKNDQHVFFVFKLEDKSELVGIVKQTGYGAGSGFIN